MKKIYQVNLASLENVENNSEKLTYLTSVLRSILQTAVISTFELTKELAPTDEVDLIELTDRFSRPADGLPLQILDVLVPIIRAYVDKQFLNGWFETTKSMQEPLSKQLINWVEFRNRRPGHGVLDAAVIEEWYKRTKQIIEDCLVVFGNIIPSIDNDGSLKLSKELDHLSIKFPLLVKQHAIVILSVLPRKGVWKLKGQLLSSENAEEFTVDLPGENVFSGAGLKPISEYNLSDFVSGGKDCSVFHNIPVRQTDTFEGRKSQLDLLVEWINDEDSRYCLVFGDGGYGKTTLVLEMLNQLLESQLDLKEPVPTIISYYSAKMTMWTEQGLTHLTGITPAMDECIRELMRLFIQVLPPEWYSVSGRQLVDKCVGVLKENKYSRNDVLLVIDNTETLATSSQEVKDLGAFFKTVGKLVGRIIITSRRREFIEATPIVIEGLSEIEGVSLMRRIAQEYNAKPILQAGESKLRKVSSQLMHKPILLEALVKYVSRSGLGIDEAIENVFKKSNIDLLEFLYEDAWARMAELQKKVFFILINMSSPLTQAAISKACQEVELQHTEFQQGLEETHFAVMTDYGKTYSIELVELAKRFFIQQFGKLNKNDRDRIKSLANSIDKYVSERERIEREYKTDRVAEAFRSEYAKAAKIYADKGDVRNAIDMYEMAIKDDPVNSSLHDRFSWLLLNKTSEFLRAKILSERAVEFDNNNCDAIVGLALVCYRLGEIENGDAHIDESQKKGRSLSFCLLRKAIARYYKGKDQNNFDTKIVLFEQAIEMLDKAYKVNQRKDGYDAKNLSDIRKFQELTRKALTNARYQKTRSVNTN